MTDSEREVTAFQIARLLKRARTQPSAKAIVSSIASDAGVRDWNMIGKSKKAQYVFARHVAYTALRRRGLTYPQIGNIMKRDHTTIIHGVRKIEALLEAPQ